MFRVINRLSNKTDKQQAFTLIELLVVVAIIGLLVSVISISFGRARMKSRDAKRLGDISQLRGGMDLYYNHGSGYPDPSLWNSGSIDCNGTHLITVPRDPLLQSYYVYQTEQPVTGCGGTTWRNYYIQFTTEADSDIGPAGTYYLSPQGMSTTPPF